MALFRLQTYWPFVYSHINGWINGYWPATEHMYVTLALVLKIHEGRLWEYTKVWRQAAADLSSPVATSCGAKEPAPCELARTHAIWFSWATNQVIGSYN